jgi:thiosulfate dehydrogenase (quinone) large subunit
MKKDSIAQSYSNWQIFSLTFLRVLIGWHFLYEGLAKLFSAPEWTARTYLLGSVGPASHVFKALAAHPALLNLVDFINIWGLILIGISLFIGLLSKPFKLFGIFLLLMYYLAYPPFASLGITAPMEGNYWIVNKNLVEMAALLVLYLFPTSQITGIDRLFSKSKD